MFAFRCLFFSSLIRREKMVVDVTTYTSKKPRSNGKSSETLCRLEEGDGITGRKIFFSVVTHLQTDTKLLWQSRPSDQPACMCSGRSPYWSRRNQTPLNVVSRVGAKAKGKGEKIDKRTITPSLWARWLESELFRIFFPFDCDKPLKTCVRRLL